MRVHNNGKTSLFNPADSILCFPTSHNSRSRNTVNPESEGSHTEVAIVHLAHLFNVFECFGHVCLQLIVHLFLIPQEALNVLQQKIMTLDYLCASCVKNGNGNEDWPVTQAQEFQIRYLHPLEVTNCHSTGVGVYVGKYNDPFLRQDLQVKRIMKLKHIFIVDCSSELEQALTSSASGSVG